ncbi:MAG: type II toxin-antitoxin system VapB family antitoxin [Hyphomicrobiaceae bacterium]
MTMQIPTEVEQLARLVAIKTGKTPETVVKEAVEARAEEAGVVAPKRKRSPEEIKASIDAIIARVSALPVLDTRSDDEILGYNEYGVPE